MNSIYKEKSFWKMLSGAFLVCLVLIVLSYQYYQHLQEEIQTYDPIKYYDWYRFNFVPISAVIENAESLLKMMLIICISFILCFMALFLLSIFFHRHYRLKIANILYVDSITGGKTLTGFYKEATNILKSMHHKQYAVVYINIRNFKMFNEQLTRNKCNEILQALYKSIEINLTNNETIGRVYADQFCVLIENQNQQKLQDRFVNWDAQVKQQIEKFLNSQWSHLEIEFGVYIAKDSTIPFSKMIDRAKLALTEAEVIDNTRLRCAFYNDRLRLQLLRQKKIEDIMEDALKKGEFQVFLQPKYSLTEGKLVGAEALTRWMAESEGMIYPNEFIPLFEKNGFILQIDLWIFEEVCRVIRRWIDEKRELVKISINCSRVHFKKSDFIKEYIRIAKFYRVPHNLIEIELTEGLAFENIQQFIHIINEIRNAGFGCSVDDFGSGFSSLSIIESFPVDTLKLDKTFFCCKKPDSKRSEAVLSNVISMAKALSMKTVAEGVEKQEQVEMLKRLGCDTIQGYVFAKPMPVKDFEQYLTILK